MSTQHTTELASMSLDQVIKHIKVLTNRIAVEEMAKWVKSQRAPQRVISARHCIQAHHSQR